MQHLNSVHLQNGDWVVTLEGLYRVKIGKASIVYPREFWVTGVSAIADIPQGGSRYASARLHSVSLNT